MAQSSHPDIGISSATLENLANKLKGVLAESPRPPKQKNNKSPKGAQKKKEKPNSTENIQKKDNKPHKRDRQEKKQQNPGKQAGKGFPKSQADSPKRRGSDLQPKKRERQADPVSSRDLKSNGSKTKSGNERKVKPKNSDPSDRKENERPSLLDEILALGGSKEDLELLDGIDSEDDLVTGSTNQKSGSKDNDKKLQKELQKQLQSLGLTGKFLDEAEDDNDVETESEWMDEDEDDSFPPKKSQNLQSKREAKSETRLQPESTLQLQTNGRGQKPGKLKLEPHALWYEIEHPSAAPPASPNTETITHLHARGKYLLQAEAENYVSSNHLSSSDRQFLSTIMSSGTQSDKLSALTLSVSSSPLHCQKQLDALMNMARKKSRNDAVQAIAALKDLLIGNLLPNRKLVYFGKQISLSSKSTDEELILWTFEDWLKGWYFQVLQAIEGLSTDSLPFVRNHMISYIFELLRDKPEQEQLLLRLLVNKLGDGTRKIAAKTSYFLLQLESAHPQMKSIILHEIENLLFRPNTSLHGQYYAIITMNQTVLTTRETPIANRLVEVYFMVFAKLLRAGVHEAPEEATAPKIKSKGKKRRGAVDWEELNQQEEEVNSKVLSAVLTGVNRAFPFSMVENEVHVSTATKSDDRFEKHMDVLFMITHDANFNTAIQALILIHQVATEKKLVLDRYYRTLYESLLDQRLATSSKQALYLNLLFKSLKADTNIGRIKAFVKRILQITSLQTPGFTCGMLFLLAELAASRPELRSLWSVSSQFSEYDPRKRDPLFANAETSSLLELSQLLDHYHPTVQLYANNLLSHQANATKPDLALHTVKHFLDRFVYRNPKVKNVARGASIMQPLPGTDTSLILGIRGNAKTEIAVNSEEWLAQQMDKIKPDEIFFHKYFVTKEESEVKASGKKRKRGEEEEELDEDEVWEALVKNSKEEGGLGDVDIDDEEDEDVDWSDDELDDDMAAEMNEEVSEVEDLSDEEMVESEQVSLVESDDGVEEGHDDWEEDEEYSDAEQGEDLRDFFDDEAEEADGIDDEDDSLAAQEDTEGEDDESYGADGRFEFGDSEDDIVGSDEEIVVPVEKVNADRTKKRKLKSLPTFASAEEYAHLLED